MRSGAPRRVMTRPNTSASQAILRTASAEMSSPDSVRPKSGAGSQGVDADGDGEARTLPAGAGQVAVTDGLADEFPYGVGPAHLGGPLVAGAVGGGPRHHRQIRLVTIPQKPPCATVL